jgi:hypothetical protein
MARLVENFRATYFRLKATAIRKQAVLTDS